MTEVGAEHPRTMESLHHHVVLHYICQFSPSFATGLPAKIIKKEIAEKGSPRIQLNCRSATSLPPPTSFLQKKDKALRDKQRCSGILLMLPFLFLKGATYRETADQEQSLFSV